MSRITKIVLILALALAAPIGLASAQNPGMDKPGMRAEQQQRREEMKARMKSQDEKLAALVATMNSAEGTAKVDAIAAVVNELVEQRNAMRGHMSQMHKRRGGGKHKGDNKGGKKTEAETPAPTS